MADGFPEFPELFSEKEEDRLTKLREEEKKIAEVYKTHYTPTAWDSKSWFERAMRRVGESGYLPEWFGREQARKYESWTPWVETGFTPEMADRIRSYTTEQIQELERKQKIADRLPTIRNYMEALAFAGLLTGESAQLYQLIDELNPQSENALKLTDDERKWFTDYAEYLGTTSIDELLENGMSFPTAETIEDLLARVAPPEERIYLSQEQVLSSVAFMQDTADLQRALALAHPINKETVAQDMRDNAAAEIWDDMVSKGLVPTGNIEEDIKIVEQYNQKMALLDPEIRDFEIEGQEGKFNFVLEERKDLNTLLPVGIKQLSEDALIDFWRMEDIEEWSDMYLSDAQRKFLDPAILAFIKRQDKSVKGIGSGFFIEDEYGRRVKVAQIDDRGLPVPLTDEEQLKQQQMYYINPDSFDRMEALLPTVKPTEIMRFFELETDDEVDKWLDMYLPKQLNGKYRDYFYTLWREGHDPYEGIGEYKYAFASGWANVIGSFGSVIHWLGEKGLGEMAIGYGEELQRQQMTKAYVYSPRLDRPDDLNWKDFWNKEFWLTLSDNAHYYSLMGVQNAPFTLSFIAAAIGMGAVIASPIGMGLGAVGISGAIGTILTGILTAGGVSLLTSSAESAVEAADVYDQLIDRGASIEEADEKANQVFKENMAVLLGTNALEVGLAFAPTKWVGRLGKLFNNKWIKGAFIGGKMVVIGLTESGQEVLQEYYSRKALGEEWEFDDEVKDVAIVAALMGLGFGGAGHILSPFSKNAQKGMSPKARQQFEADVKAHGTLQALANYAETPEGKQRLGNASKVTMEQMYNELGNAEVHTAEIDSYLVVLKDINNTIADINTEIDAQNTKIANLQAESKAKDEQVLSAKANAEHKEASLKIEQLNKEKNELQQTAREYSETIKELRNKELEFRRKRRQQPKKETTDEQAIAKEQYQAAREEINEVERAIQANRKQRVENNKKLQKKKAEAKKAKGEEWLKLNKEIEELQIENSGLDNTYNILVESINNLQKQVTDYVMSQIEEGRVKELPQKEITKQEHDKAKKELANITRAINENRSQKTRNNKEIKAKKAALKNAKGEVKEQLQVEIKQLQAENEQLDIEYEKLSQPVTELQQQIASYIQEQATIDNINTYIKVIRNLEDIQNDINRQLETTYSELQSILKEEGTTDTTKFSIENKTRYNEVMNKFFELIGKSRDNAELINKYNQSIQELQQEQVEPTIETKEEVETPPKSLVKQNSDKWDSMPQAERSGWAKQAGIANTATRLSWNELTKVQQDLLIASTPPVMEEMIKPNVLKDNPTNADLVKVEQGDYVDYKAESEQVDNSFGYTETNVPKEIVESTKAQEAADYINELLSYADPEGELDKAFIVAARTGDLNTAYLLMPDGATYSLDSVFGKGAPYEGTQFQDTGYWNFMTMDTNRVFSFADWGYFGGAARRFGLRPVESGHRAYINTKTIWQKRYLDIERNTGFDRLRPLMGQKKKRFNQNTFDVMNNFKQDYINLENNEILATDEEIRKALKGYTAEEQDIILNWAKELRMFWDEVLMYQNKFREKMGLDPIEYRDNYVSWAYRVNLWGKFRGMFMQNKHKGHGADVAFDNVDYVVPDKTFVGHALPREIATEIDFSGYEQVKDVRRLFVDYTDVAAKDMFFTPILRHIKEFAKYTAETAPNFSSWLLDWGSQGYAGMLPPLSRAMRQMPFRPFTKSSLWLRRRLTGAVFPLNLKWNLFVQTSSIALTVLQVGSKTTFKAIRYLLDADARKFIDSEMFSMIIKRQRDGQMFYQDIAGTLQKTSVAYKGKFESFMDIANYLTGRMERLLTGLSCYAGYIRGKELGLTGTRLIDYAAEIGAKTQSMYNIQNVPGLLRIDILTATFPFQTFCFEVMNSMREITGVKHIKAGAYETIAADTIDGKGLIQNRVKRMLEFLATCFVINTLYGAVQDRKPWQWNSFLPMSQILVAGADPFNTWNLPLQYRFAYDVQKGIKAVLEYDNWEPLISTITRYTTPGGVQLDRMLWAIKANIDGEVTDVAGDPLFEVRQEELLKSLLLGVYATDEGKEWKELRFSTADKTTKRILKDLDENEAKLGTSIESRYYTLSDYGTAFMSMVENEHISEWQIMDDDSLYPDLARFRYYCELLWEDYYKLPSNKRLAYRHDNPYIDASLVFWERNSRLRTKEAEKLLGEMYDMFEMDKHPRWHYTGLPEIPDNFKLLPE